MIAGIVVGSQVLVYETEVSERTRLYREAKDLATSVGKPMLLVGMPKGIAGQTPCSTGITLDIDPKVADACGIGGIVADVQSIPYPSGYFGSVAAFHVLEHLPDLESAQRAWRELWRVTATRVFVAYPRRWNLYATYLQPEHHLWVQPMGVNGEVVHVIEREGQHRTAYLARI